MEELNGQERLVLAQVIDVLNVELKKHLKPNLAFDSDDIIINLKFNYDSLKILQSISNKFNTLL